ncbi:uncharacterized protein G2W53_027429 [Senna tora]|uniref:Uncharacterized protein n=1 Tax=Senna tora TaxID=362788 RepID=A0A834WM81_9FABA|nr:uncharacterized protein G2W53_027429 [Senna tora]
MADYAQTSGLVMSHIGPYD